MPEMTQGSEPDRKHWKHLTDEIVETDICMGCAACTVACPHKILEMAEFRPHITDLTLGEDNCIHGEKGCSLCAMACPRLDPLYEVIEIGMNGRRRRHPSEPYGIVRSKVLARAKDEVFAAAGQDGGVVTALLAWMLGSGEIDGVCTALPSTETPWLDEPFVARTPDELTYAAGSRYTYCSTPVALRKASEMKLKSVAVVGVSCEASAIREMGAQGIRKWSRMVKFVAGLMCAETFSYQPFVDEIVTGRYGIDLNRITKMNVKGDVFITLDDGSEVTIPLDECRPFANEWCQHCPDFAAEHADISFGGLGLSGWTACLIRTGYGEEVWRSALDAGIIETRPFEEEPKAERVLTGLSKKQRRRVGPLQPHAQGRWSVAEVLQRVRAEAIAAGAVDGG